jgi:beta-phosphoglucomutase family hydrolase
MQTVKAFIFDMDGTMVDNMSWHCKAWVELFRDEGVEVEEKEFMRLAGKTTPELVKTFIGREVTDDEIRHLGAQKEFLYRYMYREHIHPVKGLRGLLRDAKAAGIKIGVATAALPKNIEFTLTEIDVKQYLDAVVGAAEVAHGKPEPDLFLLVAERLGVKPDECVVFEDAQMGFEAAHRAGMAAYGITTGHSREEILAMNGVTGAASDFTVAEIRNLLKKTR